MFGIICFFAKDLSTVYVYVCFEQNLMFPIKKFLIKSIKNLYRHIEQFPPSIREGIVVAEKIYLFAHINAFIDKDDPFRKSKNFASLYYDSISSPFLLFKMYLDTLYRILFNISETFILLALLSSVRGSCRSFTACTSENFPGLKSRTVKAVSTKAPRIVLYLVRSSCKNVNPSFVQDVYNSYKRDRDFFSCFLEFDRNE